MVNFRDRIDASVAAGVIGRDLANLLLAAPSGFEGKINTYTCEACRARIVTRDVDRGATPMLTRCRVTPGCAGYMRSGFYRCSADLLPTHEWIRPDSLDGLDRGVTDHVRRGGLILVEAA